MVSDLNVLSLDMHHNNFVQEHKKILPLFQQFFF